MEEKSVNTPENQSTEAQQPEQPKVTIEIVKHKQLFDVLRDPKALWRVIASLFVIVAVLFVGLAFIVLVMKSFYPYNTIQTNQYGATIMKTEDKEVIYWLFNTAELWANSGIEVKKGDKLTIRSSGASNTAIHYLVDAANDDKEVRYNWVNTEGSERESRRSELRKVNRIAPNKPYGILLMQIIPRDSAKVKADWIKSDEAKPFLDGKGVNQVITIGKERTELIMPSNGILHFAVNDIVMSDKIIDDFYVKNLKWYNDNDTVVKKQPYTPEDLIKIIDEICNREDSLKSKYNDIIKVFNSEPYKSIRGTRNKKGYDFGYFYNDTTKGDGETYYPLLNELIYYKLHKYRDPWYIDNVGSFLIVIERKTDKQ